MPQRNALGTAFGLVTGSPPDRLLVGLGTLTLLADAATSRAMLCVVDDAHWLDRESLDAFAFVARRLDADGIGLLLAVRAGEPTAEASLDGLRIHSLAGLDRSSAREIIAANGSQPDEQVPGATRRGWGLSPMRAGYQS